MRVVVALLCVLCFSSLSAAQTPHPGRQAYMTRCAGCHGTNGNGGELGPSIVSRVPARTDEDLTILLRQGLPTAGMPAFPGLVETEVRDLIGFMRTLKPSEGSEPVRTKLTLTTGTPLDGLVLNQGVVDLQLLGDDRKIHLLRKTGDRYRPVTSQADWPSYNGQTNGSRYSPLAQISKANVARLVPKWIFGLPNTPPLQVTPVVVDGVMYVTSANQCYALDAGSGRRDLALSAPTHLGTDRQRRRRRESWRRRGGRSGLHGHRSRTYHRAEPPYRRAALGNRDGGLASELQRDGSATDGGKSGHHRNGRR